MNEIDFIRLNCYGTLTNMMINAEMLELTRRHNRVMESILSELKKLNGGDENGGDNNVQCERHDVGAG